MAVTRQGSVSTSDTTNALAHTIAAGNNRALIVAVQQEDKPLSQLAVSYGGQSMTAIVGIGIIGVADLRVDLYFLNDAGIEAAADDEIDLTDPPVPPDIGYGIIAQTYAGALQTTPTTVDSESAAGDSDPLTNIQIAAVANQAVIGLGASGNFSTGVTWAGTNPLTALANLDTGISSHAAMADRLVTATETVNHNLTFTTAPNRLTGCAFLLEAAVRPILRPPYMLQSPHIRM